jgi:KAP family P-loop domain
MSTDRTSVSKNPAKRTNLTKEWIHFAGIVIVACVCGAVLLGSRGRLTEATRPYFEKAPDWMRHAAILATCVVAVNLLTRLLKPSFKHLNRRAWHHPPAWLGVGFAIALLAILDVSGHLGPQEYCGTWKEWLMYTSGSCAFVYTMLWASKLNDTDSNRDAVPLERSIHDLLTDPIHLQRWYVSEGSATEDLLGTRPTAVRLAKYLSEGFDRPRTVGLVGRFGSGKTSVVRWFRSHVEHATELAKIELWTCEVSCWGFEDTGSAAEHILRTAIETVGERLDCFSFRSLPEAYRKTFSAGGDWVKSVTDLLFGETDPKDQLERLSEVLAAAKARLVIIIEDLDRTSTTRFDRNEVLALLERLRKYPALSFIITGGPTLNSGIDYTRLCERVEYIQNLQLDHVLIIVTAFRRREIGRFTTDVPTTSDEQNPWSINHMMAYLSPERAQLGDSLCELLVTPRSLKFVLRHTAFAWDTLHGEVNFDHLLALNVLRHSAPGAFQFVEAHRDNLCANAPLQTTSREREDNSVHIREAWRAIIVNVDWNSDAAFDLIRFMFPRLGNIFNLPSMSSHSPHQGFGDPGYLLRGLNGHLNANENRDQEVLSLIREWLASPSADRALVRRLHDDDEFANRWEYFSRRGGFPANRLLQLAGDLISIIQPNAVEIMSSSTNEGLISIWRRAIDSVRGNEESFTWLECQIVKAMSRSLVLANDLYYYWATPRPGILAQGDRARIRSTIYTRAQAQFTSADALLRVLHPHWNYDIFHLLFPADADQPEASPYRHPEDWAWLGPILRDAILADPSVVVSKVAHLISRARDRGPDGGTVHVFSPRVLRGVFGDLADEVLRLLRVERDSATGQLRLLLDQVLDSAATTGEPGSNPQPDTESDG